jgi:glutaredoxin
MYYQYILLKNHMYVIIKHIKTESKKRVPVIILNGESEIWEFETEKEAEKMREIFELNSDSGYKYEVKKI